MSYFWINPYFVLKGEGKKVGEGKEVGEGKKVGDYQKIYSVSHYDGTNELRFRNVPCFYGNNIPTVMTHFRAHKFVKWRFRVPEGTHNLYTRRYKETDT